MHRRSLLLALVLCTVPLAAQTTHVVSRIAILGKVPAQIVISQSALVEGREYTDRDLEIAIARVRRLPFVYDARYSFDGEALIIDVVPMTRFFAGIDVLASSFPGDTSAVANLGGGARFFLGSGGVAAATLNELLAEGGTARSVGAEYAHYGIGGTRFFAVAGVQNTFTSDEGFEPDPTWALTVGTPLTLRQTLSLSARREGFTSVRTLEIVPGPQTVTSDQNTLNLRWSYDTTEDPFFARHGETIDVIPSWTRRESLFEGNTILFPSRDIVFVSRLTEGTTTALTLDAKKLWAFGARSAIVAGVNGSRNNEEVEVRTDGGSPLSRQTDITVYGISLTVAHNLFDWSSPLDYSRQRLELGVRTSRRTFDDPFQSTTSEHTGVMAGWALRRRFINARIQLSYDFD